MAISTTSMSFNPTVVRLKLENRFELLAALVGFNPTVVLLKLGLDGAYISGLERFQSYSSPIKTYGIVTKNPYFSILVGLKLQEFYRRSRLMQKRLGGDDSGGGHTKPCCFHHFRYSS